MLDDEEISIVEFREILADVLEQIDNYLITLNKPQHIWNDSYTLQLNKMQDITRWN